MGISASKKTATSATAARASPTAQTTLSEPEYASTTCPLTGCGSDEMNAPETCDYASPPATAAATAGSEMDPAREAIWLLKTAEGTAMPQMPPRAR